MSMSYHIITDSAPVPRAPDEGLTLKRYIEEYSGYFLLLEGFQYDENLGGVKNKNERRKRKSTEPVLTTDIVERSSLPDVPKFFSSVGYLW